MHIDEHLLLYKTCSEVRKYLRGLTATSTGNMKDTMKDTLKETRV